jgi:Pyruvate/2-oxoacid:ferredoxin oxidoreductase delta subunit
MVMQHVTDPKLCIQCSACEMACPQKAIESIVGRYCINNDLCKNCRICIKECPTGAADCFIEVSKVYSLAQQAEWTALPYPLTQIVKAR